MEGEIQDRSHTGRRALSIVLLIAFAVAIALATGGCTTVKRWAYEGFGGRDDWQQPERVITELSLEPGQRVADVGSGGGYFTFRLAEAVGTEGRVYAVDVDEGMLDYVRDEAAERGLANITAVAASFDDPKIPEPVDLVFVSNTYHHLDDRARYFDLVRRSYLRAGGRVAIVEYFGDEAHATPREKIEQEMGEAGFRLVTDSAWLERQAFLIFGAR
jgi:arsenite methyltransferase